MYKFELKRALAGEPVVTRGGDTVMRIERGIDRAYVVSVTLADYSHYSVTETGNAWKSGAESPLDLFMKYPPLKEGDYILVSDDKKTWRKRKFIHIDFNNRVVVVDKYCADDFDNGRRYAACSYKYYKRIEEEPEIEITVKINGKDAKLSDISAETLEKIKQLENENK